MKDATREELAGRLAGYGQEHVVAGWEGLSAGERVSLARQLEGIDLALVERLSASMGRAGRLPERLEGAEFTALPESGGSEREWGEAREAGEEALREGRVAAFVVAGGQGTRLGFDGPKGAFEIGPVTGRTLFRIHAEKVLAASRRYGVEIPFLVMTSSSNDGPTRAFFEKHDYFGIPKGLVRIFPQGELPAMTPEGKLLLDEPGHIFMSPNGHGGSLEALWTSGTVEWLDGRGVELVSYFQVDNPLVRVIDAAFIGFHVTRGAQMSLKLLRRTIPDEKLGIWVKADGREKVIEYIDMPTEEMKARDGQRRLKYQGGSIAIHCFSVGFVRRINAEGFALPYHFAKKKVARVDEAGEMVKPEEPNAVKFETFVFDALELAEKVSAVETTREEFSPVKNAEGADSPATARRDMTRHFGRWLAEAGVEVELDGEGRPVYGIEISPLAADSAEALKETYSGATKIEGPTVIE